MLANGVDAEHRRALEVGRADLARVAAAEDVVQRDEPELARMARRPRDDHAPRLEQRREPLVQIPNPQLPSPAAVAPTGRRRFEFDERVYCDGLAVDDDEGVDVDGGYVGAFGGEAGEAEEGRAQRGAVDRGLAAELAEQLLGGEIVDQLVGVELGEGDDAERDVAEALRRARRRRRASRTGRTADRARGRR